MIIYESIILREECGYNIGSEYLIMTNACNQAEERNDRPKDCLRSISMVTVHVNGNCKSIRSTFM